MQEQTRPFFVGGAKKLPWRHPRQNRLLGARSLDFGPGPIFSQHFGLNEKISSLPAVEGLATGLKTKVSVILIWAYMHSA